MKKLLIVTSLLLFPLPITQPSKVPAPAVTYEPSTKTTVRTPLKVVRGSKLDFMRKVAQFESKGVIDTINRFGMLGKYQFDRRTLRDLNIHVSEEQFLINESLQDSAMSQLIARNKRILARTIRRFDGTMFNGVYITASGIIAGAHLVGPGGILTYFYPDKYSHMVLDGNGVHVEYYITKFGGYSL